MEQDRIEYARVVKILSYNPVLKILPYIGETYVSVFYVDFIIIYEYT